MGVYVGRRAALGVAKEATRGDQTTPTNWIPYSTINFDQKAVIQDAEGGFETIDDGEQSHVTKKHATGDFEAVLDDKEIGVILCAVMGAAPSSVGPTNYTHTYAFTNTNEHQSLSIYIKDPNVSTLFIRSMIDTFTITIEPEGIIHYSTSWRSGLAKDWEILTPVYTSLGNKLLHSHLIFSLADDIASLPGTTLKLRRLELTFSKNIIDWDELGTLSPSDILNQQFTVEGSLEIAYTDVVWRDYMLNGTYKAMEVNLAYGANNGLKLQFPRVNFRSWEPQKGLDDIATQTIEFKALYDAANAQNLIHLCELKNQTSSY